MAYHRPVASLSAPGRSVRAARLPVLIGVLAPPLAAFVVARLVVILASIHTGRGFPDATDLARADSFNYLSIAAHGYTLHRCPPGCVPSERLPWTGNAGWFPLYPLLLAPFSPLGVAPLAGVVISGVCQFAALALLWRWFIRGCSRPQALALMALAAVFPGSIYFAAIFPLSMLVLLFLVGLRSLVTARIGSATVTAFFAALAYPLGCLYGAVAWLGFRQQAGRIAAVISASAVGLGLLALAQRLMTGHWDAYLLSQSGRGHGLHNPAPTLRAAMTGTINFLKAPSRTGLIPEVQIVLVACIVAAALLSALPDLRSPLTQSTALIVASCWAVPIVLGGVSLYRTDAALFPALVLLRRAPWQAVALLAVAAAPVAFLISALFFRSRLGYPG